MIAADSQQFCDCGTVNNARRESWLISYSALGLGYCEWPGSWCMLYNIVVRSVLFWVPTLKYIGCMQSKASGKPVAHVYYCRKVNSKLSEVTGCFIACFFSRVLEFDQYNWLTEEQIRGHRGHETGNCILLREQTWVCVLLSCTKIQGVNDDEDRLTLLLADFLPFPPWSINSYQRKVNFLCSVSIFSVPL